MSTMIASVDDRSDDWRGFSTPPMPRRCLAVAPAPATDQKPRRKLSYQSPVTFHVIHKIPSGNSPYCKAKYVQLIDKDPNRAISLFWAAINSRDRVDSALKDMAVVMKQLNRADEAIEAMKSFRHLCPPESQESLENILVELFKQSGRIDEEIKVLQEKLKRVEDGIAFGGKRTKIARSQGKKVLITLEKEYSRLLGNLGWAYMQAKDFKSAEEHYRKALTFEPDKNKQCNLAVCLIHMDRLSEAKFLLQAVRGSSKHVLDEAYAKSYERACELLAEKDSKETANGRKRVESHTDSSIAREPADGDLKRLDNDHPSMSNADVQRCSVAKHSGKMNSRAFFAFSYEKGMNANWRSSHHMLKPGQKEAYPAEKRIDESPSWNSFPRAPFTQPHKLPRCVDQRKGRQIDTCRKLCFGSFNQRETFEVVMPPVSDYEDGRKMTSLKLDKDTMRCLGYVTTTSEESKFSSDSSLSGDAIKAEDTDFINHTEFSQHKKTWADMVEEDQFFMSHVSSFGTQHWSEDESHESVVTLETPKCTGKNGKMGSFVDENGYFSQPEKTVRRSLCFCQ